jgi:hypothetical protein
MQHLFANNPKVLFHSFNKGLQATVIIGGHDTNDKVIWEYFSDSSHVVCIPKKPHSTGLHAYKWCFPLTLFSKPIVYYVLPDLMTSCFTGIETMDVLLQQWPYDVKISTTADSFFCNLNWLRNNTNTSVTFTVPVDHFPLVSLFAKSLKWYQYCVFTDGKIIVSLWLDNKLVITTSNALKAIPL